MLHLIHARTPLEWVQTGVEQAAFDLRAENELIGTLQQCQPGGPHFLAQAADGAWTFTWCGLLRPQVLVTRINETQPLAVLRKEANGGTFRLKDGHIYTWLSRVGWFHDGLWTDEHACVLIRLCIPEGFTTSTGQVIIVPAAFALPELSLLILFGWYLLIRELEDFLMGVLE